MKYRDFCSPQLCRMKRSFQGRSHRSDAPDVRFSVCRSTLLSNVRSAARKCKSNDVQGIGVPKRKPETSNMQEGNLELFVAVSI